MGHAHQDSVSGGISVLAILAGLAGARPLLAASDEADIDTVLVVLIDDFGPDRCSFAVPPGEDCPQTPTMDWLATTGAVFPRCYAMPSCKPTRASLLTGRLPRVHGLGSTKEMGEIGLGPWPTSLLLQPLGDDVHVTAIGKWHLFTAPHHILRVPLVETSHLTRGNLLDYWDYRAVEDGWRGQVSTRYATSFFADEVIESLRAPLPPDRGGAEPRRVIYWAPHAGHKPFHEPPPELVHVPSDGTKDDQWRAMIEALDTELERVLSSLDPDARGRLGVVLVSDNGTPTQANRLPQGRGKGTTYEGAIRMPLIVHGAGIEPGVREQDLVSILDILPTVRSMLHPKSRERGPAGCDGQDPAPTLWPRLAAGWQQRPLIRRTVVSETFAPNLADGGPPEAGKLTKWKVASVHRDGWKLRVDHLARPERRRMWYRARLDPQPWDEEVDRVLVPLQIREELELAAESGGRWD